MNSLDLNFIKQTGMVEYFKSHILLLGVGTEALCFTAYHWGQWNLSKFRYGEQVVSCIHQSLTADGDRNSSDTGTYLPLGEL